MPNDLQQAYLDGAAMAYRDVATKIKEMILKAPSEIGEMLKCMEPFADSCLKKADGIYEEADRIENATRQ